MILNNEKKLKDTPGSTTSQLSRGDTKSRKRLKRISSAHSGVMQAVAMKFCHIKRSFLVCRTAFDKYANNLNVISKVNVKSILLELGGKPEILTDEEIERIVKVSNTNNRDDKMNFRTFLIAIAIGYFLKFDPNEQSNEFVTIRKGFDVAKEAFGKINTDGSGKISFEELKTAFLSMREDDLIQERLRELGFNGSKEIEFPDFVYGISAWVGMDDDDDNASDQNFQNNGYSTSNVDTLNDDDNNTTHSTNSENNKEDKNKNN